MANSAVFYLKKVYRAARKVWLQLYYKTVKFIPGLKVIFYTKESQTPVSLSNLFIQKIIGINRQAYWPMHFTSKVSGGKNVYCGIDSAPGCMPGCYIQAIDKVYIGDYTQLGPNVGIISTNHDVYDSRKNLRRKPIRIGKYCWIGMNAVILPGVELGDFTIVSAGSVVSRSFKNGFCIIGGNPAKFMFSLDKTKCVFYRNKYEYNGFIRHDKFLRSGNKYFKES
jgi:acetyltransferase-like isoleucine patch superfamily enzyme